METAASFRVHLRQHIMPSCSEAEKCDSDHLQLGLEEVERSLAAAQPSADQTASQQQSAPQRKPAQRNRGSLPPHQIILAVENKHCPCCSGALHLIDEGVSEMLDMCRHNTGSRSSGGRATSAAPSRVPWCRRPR
jgi:hypothetical protein